VGLGCIRDAFCGLVADSEVCSGLLLIGREERAYFIDWDRSLLAWTISRLGVGTFDLPTECRGLKIYFRIILFITMLI
jgi:hypothetical protein